MSDDVLDNWEEIDEASLTNTLNRIQGDRKTQEPTSDIRKLPSATIATTTNNSYPSSDCQPMKLLQRSSTKDCTSSSPVPTASVAESSVKSPLDNMAATFEPVMMVLHKTNDEYQSANYTQPINSQTVKILRRPTQSSEPRNNGMKPRQPIKTLQQREQEYAKARLRILGSAKNPEDDANASQANSVSASLSPSTTKLTTTVTNATMTKAASSPKLQGSQNHYNNYFHQQQLQQQQNYFYSQQQLPAYNNRTLTMSLQQLPQQQQQQTWSPIVGGSVSSPILRQQQDSILRMPRGPDGSTGFQMRR